MARLIDNKLNWVQHVTSLGLDLLPIAIFIAILYFFLEREKAECCISILADGRRQMSPFDSSVLLSVMAGVLCRKQISQTLSKPRVSKPWHNNEISLATWVRNNNLQKINKEMLIYHVKRQQFKSNIGKTHTGPLRSQIRLLVQKKLSIMMMWAVKKREKY